MWKILQSLLQRAQVVQSRSSVVNPLQWTLVITLTALLIVALAPTSHPRLLTFVACVVGIVVVCLLFAYVFFMFTNPDALRSEKFSLVKTALEKRMVGDSLSGMRELINSFEDSGRHLLGSATGEDIGRGNEE